MGPKEEKNHIKYVLIGKKVEKGATAFVSFPLVFVVLRVKTRRINVRIS